MTLQIFVCLAILAFLIYVGYLLVVLRRYPDTELVKDIELMKKESAALKVELLEIREAQDLLNKQARLMIIAMEELGD